MGNEAVGGMVATFPAGGVMAVLTALSWTYRHGVQQFDVDGFGVAKVAGALAMYR